MLSQGRLSKQYNKVRRDLVTCAFDTFVSQAIHPNGFIRPMGLVPKDLDCAAVAEAKDEREIHDALVSLVSLYSVRQTLTVTYRYRLTST